MFANKAKKGKKPFSPSVKIVILSACIAVIMLITILLNVLMLGVYNAELTRAVGKAADRLEGDKKGADVNYVKSDFASASELYEYEENLVAQIAQEGVTLLENDGLLPLAKGTMLSLFSHSSVDLVSGGSGSGSGSFELTLTLKQGLEDAGLKVNETLWNFYESGNGSKYKRGVGVINYGVDLDWRINECPISEIKSDSAVVSSFGDSVAMFVLSRTGGEGGDLARDMAAYSGKSGSHYLEPDETELGVIEYLNKTFDNVILLVNCNNAPELGWVKNYKNIKAVVNFPGAGRTGTRGLGYVLTGLDKDGKEISPSGHLVDTFVYDNFSSPAMQNMGDFAYDGTDYYYVNYAEGIYVGYKYYETRYEDVVKGRAGAGDYDYTSTVLYPFGYGLSYTTFEWSNFTVGVAANGKINVSLTVTNTGTRRGKDTVQIYVSSPYTDYDIANGVEKSSVSLVGFKKTDFIAPNGHEDVHITLDLKDFTSYDANGAKTYILDAGTYYITAASDAHKAVNSILAAQDVTSEKLVGEGNPAFVGTYTQNELDKTTYAVGVNNVAITNLFDNASLTDTPYLSRSDWSVMDNDGLRYGTASDKASGAEIGGKQWSHSISKELKAALDSRSSLNPAEGTVTAKYKFGADNGVDLVDLRGLSYDDPLWDKLLDQITLSELAELIDESGYYTIEMLSINKPKAIDLDGPAGLNDVEGHGSSDIGKGLKAMTWPSEYMLACTWNEELAEKMGDGMGEDGLYSGAAGWYGPGMNIHRTPFAGRNFEYYSEDSYFSGVLGKAEVHGAANKGLYAFVKHFALNDQETHRDQMGIVTWAQEQAIREIYLKPFEMTVVDNTVTVRYNEPEKNASGDIKGYTMKTSELPATFAIMSSFNRIGATWAGGNYNLITGVLRNEWGFNGFVLTDYEVASYMHTNQCIAAGGDAKLKADNIPGNFKFGFSLEGDAEGQAYAREAAHHILYTVVNSSAMNGLVHGVKIVKGFAYYKIIVIVWDVLAGIGLAVLVFLLIKHVRSVKSKRVEQNKE
ncbi:MAG: glycoside hydrolase family 3 C-terminal domain-containing protein [Clostridiales bacterium]|nr:glycoside hydrolase family 3 C-terminal domain-containing protein [Clostridiales bacterium]